MLTKTWTSKADWDSGALDKTYCPIGLGQLELAYDELFGTGVWIFDGGAGRKFNWQSFEHTKEDQKTIWRDDFRVDSRSKYPLRTLEPQGWPPISPGYDATNHRLIINTAGSKCTMLEIPGVLIKNAIAQLDVYVSTQFSGDALSVVYLRRQDINNWYSGFVRFVGTLDRTGISKRVAGVAETLEYADWLAPMNTWRTHVFEANNSSLKTYTADGTLSAADSALTWAKNAIMGLGRAAGYMTNFLVQHYTLPSPPNASISFQFAASDNGADWSSWTSDITACANSRYIKVKTSMSRTNFLSSAMPVLKDMTLTYKLLVEPIFI